MIGTEISGRYSHVASSAAESPPPITAKGLFLKRYAMSFPRRMEKYDCDIPENGDSTITDSASTDTTLPIRLLASEAQTLRTGTSGNDDGVCGLWLLILLEFTPVSERSCREVDFGNGLCDNLCSESQ